MELRDRLARPLRDLRISVTDRCNFRCTYCMPKEVFGPGFHFLPKSALLSYEEISRLVRILARQGVEKVRLTGGEPLLRTDLPELVRMLAAVPGIADLTLTTNGMLLARQAAAFKEAGLGRVTVSLDSLDDEVFRAMNDVGRSAAAVLAGIDAAAAVGLGPIKVNAVVQRGVNDHTLVGLARHFRGSGHVVRFIEYMDVGTTNGWRLAEVVTAEEIVARIDAVFPLEPLGPNYPGEVARRWRYRDGGGEIGVIAAVSQPFCGDCSRLRLSSEGRLFTCLFAATGFDLRAPLRGGADDETIAAAVAGLWRRREDRYSELRSAATADLPRVEMSHIGG
jgi:GTP 3',8-cyclase